MHSWVEKYCGYVPWKVFAAHTRSVFRRELKWLLEGRYSIPNYFWYLTPTIRMTWPSRHRHGLRGGWREQAVMGKFSRGLEWRELTVVSISPEDWGDENDSSRISWRVMRFIRCLGRGVCIISLSKRVWNVMSLIHDFKRTGSKKEAVSMLRILFLAVFTGDTRFNTENWIWWKVRQ